MSDGGVVCAQIGAREHYAIPRAFLRQGRLDSVVTDLWATKASRRVLDRLSALKALTARGHDEIPDAQVVSFPAAAVRWRVRDLWNRPQTVEETCRRYLATGEEFGRLARRHLSGRLQRGACPEAFFTYTTGALEPLEFLAATRLPTLVGQIDPARTEEAIVQAEAERWPGWARTPGRIPEEYFRRLEVEWALATRVVVNSEWSQQALVAQGVPPEKIVVLPLAFERPLQKAVKAGRTGGRVTVLWVGQVVVRKGIQYLMEAARLIRGGTIRFVVAGPIGISDEALRQAPPNVRFAGPVPRSEATRLYANADLFVFPTLSDGFGITQLEAMAHGLPVIATPNCGRVVTDGVDGRVIPPGDAEALASAILDMASDKDRLRAMSIAAIETSRRYSIDAMSVELAKILDEITG